MSAQTFLQSVVQIFQANAIIRGDTDAPTSFSDTQHNASMGLAQLAVKMELVDLVSRRLIPKERRTTGTLTTVATTRVYDLATDFIRFFGTPHLYNTTDQINIGQYRGGLAQLQLDDQRYATAPGNPLWFYEEPANSTNKQIGLYLVPNVVRTFTYDYEASTIVSSESDALPFYNTEESLKFSEMAGRRFKFMWEDADNIQDIQRVLENDYSYKSARASLYGLIKQSNPRNAYGKSYR